MTQETPPNDSRAEQRVEPCVEPRVQGPGSGSFAGGKFAPPSRSKARLKRGATSFGLTAACLFVGYGFYSMNHRDWLNAVFFTVGLLGIMLSVLRRQKSSDSDSKSDQSSRS